MTVDNPVMFTEQQLEVIRFCAVECKFQMSGEESVSWMTRAWEYAVEHNTHLDSPVLDDVVQLGKFVEPMQNVGGFRTCDVRVGNDVKAPWTLVPQLMVELMEDQEQRNDPGQWFFRYENVHPFRDGNGRTGAILYNWLRGTLRRPSWPPDFWRDKRRKPGYGAPEK